MPKSKNRSKANIHPLVSDPLPRHYPLSSITDLHCPASDIWSNAPATTVQEPAGKPDENAPPQIFGDLTIMDPLSTGSTPPPFITKDHFNSRLLLSRLLKTHDKLTSLDIKMMQESDPHFREVIKNINHHKDFSHDPDGILFKHVVSRAGP